MPRFDDGINSHPEVTARFADETTSLSENADFEAARYGGSPDYSSWSGGYGQNAYYGQVIPTLRPDQTGNPYDRSTYNPDTNLARLYNDATRSVVAIEDDVMAKGTGFFVTTDGRLATDYHVVQDARGQIRVKTLDGRVYNAYIENVDRANDVAILSVQPSQPYERFQALQLGGRAYEGMPAIAVGRPRDWSNLFLSPGQFQSVKPYYQVAKSGTLGPWNNDQRGVWQIYMHTEKGNSGSPILDQNGRVVAMVDLSDSKSLTSGTPVQAIERLLAATPSRRQVYPQRSWTDMFADNYSNVPDSGYYSNQRRYESQPGYTYQGSQPPYNYYSRNPRPANPYNFTPGYNDFSRGRGTWP